MHFSRNTMISPERGILFCTIFKQYKRSNCPVMFYLCLIIQITLLLHVSKQMKKKKSYSVYAKCFQGCEKLGKRPLII